MQERWGRIDAIFAAALERPQAEQKAFVERSCGDDHMLFAAVLALLDADSKALTFLERPPVAHAASRLADLVGDQALPKQARQGGRGRVMGPPQDWRTARGLARPLPAARACRPKSPRAGRTEAARVRTTDQTKLNGGVPWLR